MTERTKPGSSCNQSQFTTVQRRCKLCQSPHRREIEIMLATGWSQAWVREHWNQFLGTEHFTANNLSVHTRRHLNHSDPHIASFARRSAAGIPESSDQPAGLLQLREQVAQLVRYELAALEAGLLLPDVGDMLKAIDLLGKIEDEAWPAERATMTREMKAFVGAVKNIASDRGEEIYAEYERLLAESTPEANGRRTPRWIL